MSTPPRGRPTVDDTRFTVPARQALLGAREEARRCGHPYLGTEHLLLALAGLGAPLPALRAEVAALLAARGLPTALDPAVDTEAVRRAVERDKKRRDGRVGFVLVDAPGRVLTGRPVAGDELAAALEELRRA